MQLRNLMGRSSAERRLLFEAATRLAGLRLLLVIIGRRKQLALYGRGMSPADGEALIAAMGMDDRQRRVAGSIAWAIQRAEHALPFEVNCLPQALVGRAMLRSRGIASVMFFGVERERPMERADTHAWLVAGDVPVTGYPAQQRYIPFAAFPSSDASVAS